MDAESWEDEAFEQEEMRDVTARLTSDPVLLALWKKAAQQMHSDATRRAERQRVFAHLVFLHIIACAPFSLEPNALLHWRACVLNNSYAVALPDDRANVLDLAQDFVAWYMGTLPKPDWVPPELAFTDAAKLPILCFSMEHLPSHEDLDAAS